MHKIPDPSPNYIGNDISKNPEYSRAACLMVKMGVVDISAECYPRIQMNVPIDSVGKFMLV